MIKLVWWCFRGVNIWVRSRVYISNAGVMSVVVCLMTRSWLCILINDECEGVGVGMGDGWGDHSRVFWRGIVSTIREVKSYHMWRLGMGLGYLM